MTVSPAFITAAKKISVTAPSIRFGVIDCAGQLPSNRTVLERFKLPPVNYSASPTGYLFANSERPVQASLAMSISPIFPHFLPNFSPLSRTGEDEEEQRAERIDALPHAYAHTHSYHYRNHGSPILLLMLFVSKLAGASGSGQVRDGPEEACAVGRKVQVPRSAESSFRSEDWHLRVEHYATVCAPRYRARRSVVCNAHVAARLECTAKERQICHATFAGAILPAAQEACIGRA